MGLAFGARQREPSLMTFCQGLRHHRRWYDVRKGRRAGPDREIQKAIKESRRGEGFMLLAHMPPSVRAFAPPSFDLNRAESSAYLIRDDDIAIGYARWRERRYHTSSQQLAHDEMLARRAG